MREVVETAEARETKLRSALEELTQMHESRMSQAEDLLCQQRRLINKMREECRSNVEVGSMMIDSLTFLIDIDLQNFYLL